MKKLLFILLLASFTTFAQGGPKVDVIKFSGSVTTTVRDTFDVPLNETWLIFNTTTNQLEFGDENEYWQALSDAVISAHEIVNIPTGNLSATNVQGALNELQTDIDGLAGGGAVDNSISEVDQSLIGKSDRGFNIASFELDFHSYGASSLLLGANGGIQTNELETIGGIGTINVLSPLSYNNAVSGLTATDIKSAIDELKVYTDAQVGANNDTQIIESAIDGYTVTSNDLITGRKWFVTSSATDVGISLPSVASVGQKVSFKAKGVGKINITLLGTGQEASTKDISAITYIYHGAIDGWLPEGYWDAYTSVSCTADPNEQYTTANAASDPNCNEANATTGFVGNNNTLTSDGDSNVGDYAIKGVATTTSGAYLYYRFSATAGDTFTVTWDEKKTIGTTQTVTAWQNCTGGPSWDAIGTSWTSESYNITASSTGDVEMRFYSSNGGNIGDDVFVDNISIVKTN